MFHILYCRLKKMHNVRVASSVLFGGKLRTEAWDTEFQIALRNCSKDVGGQVNIYVILLKGERMQSSLYIYIYLFIYLFRRFLLVMRSSHHHEGF